MERVRRHKRFEIFKGSVRKGRGVRVPLFCLVRGCSRETRITHELALSQFYTRHVPSKRVVKSTRVVLLFFLSSSLFPRDTLCPLTLADLVSIQSVSPPTFDSNERFDESSSTFLSPHTIHLYHHYHPPPLSLKKITIHTD